MFFYTKLKPAIFCLTFFISLDAMKDAQDGKILYTSTKPIDYIDLRNNQLAMAINKQAILLDIVTLQKKIIDFNHGIRQIKFAPDGNKIALISLESFCWLKPIGQGKCKNFNAQTISFNSKYNIVSDVSYYLLADTKGNIIKEIPENQRIYDAQHSPDGNYLACCVHTYPQVEKYIQIYKYISTKRKEKEGMLKEPYIKEIAHLKNNNISYAPMGCLWHPNNRHLLVLYCAYDASGYLSDSYVASWDTQKKQMTPINNEKNEQCHNASWDDSGKIIVAHTIIKNSSRLKFFCSTTGNLIAQKKLSTSIDRLLVNCNTIIASTPKYISQNGDVLSWPNTILKIAWPIEALQFIPPQDCWKKKLLNCAHHYNFVDIFFEENYY